MKIVAIALLLTFAMADIIDATDMDSVTAFEEDNKDAMSSFLFTTPKSGGLFSLFGLFASEETDSSFMLEVAEHSHLLKIDTTNTEFDELKTKYEITETPWIVVFDQGEKVLSEKPDKGTQEEVIAIVTKYLSLYKIKPTISVESRPYEIIEAPIVIIESPLEVITVPAVEVQ